MGIVERIFTPFVRQSLIVAWPLDTQKLQIYTTSFLCWVLLLVHWDTNCLEQLLSHDPLSLCSLVVFQNSNTIWRRISFDSLWRRISQLCQNNIYWYSIHSITYSWKSKESIREKIFDFEPTLFVICLTDKIVPQTESCLPRI